MSRKVTFVRFHSNLDAPGAMGFGDAFPPVSKTLTDLEMTTTISDGVLLKFTYKGVKKELLVGAGNIKLIDLAPEETKKSSK